jgi:hypothetical protein
MADTTTTMVREKPKASKDEAAVAKFNIFTLRTNQKIYKEMTAKRNVDRMYIDALEDVIMRGNLTLPERVEAGKMVPSGSLKRLASTLDDTEALSDLLVSLKELHRIYRVQICFKDLGYWTMAHAPHIPTVGSAFSDGLFGHGQKHRVDILKNLTGKSNERDYSNSLFTDCR